MNNTVVFKPEPQPRILKTNIKKITQHISRRITEIGYNVYISFSKKSESRYLEVRLSANRKINIRISDHIAGKGCHWHQFDIHTTTQRKGSMNYIEFLDTFKQIIGIKRSKTKKITPGEIQGKE